MGARRVVRTWHEAREARLARIDDEHRRWQEERKRMEESLARVPPPRVDGQRHVRVPVRATKTKIERFEADRADRSGSRPPGDDAARRRPHRHAGGRSASSSSCTASPTRSTPRSCTASGSRCSARTAPARATSCACSPASPSATTGGGGSARVSCPGYFSQTHDHPELRGVDVLDIVMKAGTERGKAMAALRRYGIHGCAQQPFETLSGGQQARLQILLLELSGAPCSCSTSPPTTSTSRRPRRSRRRSGAYVGTVVAVTHDRWFLRGFDRFLVFGRDGTVTEHLEPVWE